MGSSHHWAKWALVLPCSAIQGRRRYNIHPSLKQQIWNAWEASQKLSSSCWRCSNLHCTVKCACTPLYKPREGRSLGQNWRSFSSFPCWPPFLLPWVLTDGSEVIRTGSRRGIYLIKGTRRVVVGIVEGREKISEPAERLMHTKDCRI